jgi:hypothetical protein
MTRPGAGAVGAISGTKALSRGGAAGGAGGGGTIVKAEFQDVFFRQDTPDGDANNLNLAKVSATLCAWYILCLVTDVSCSFVVMHADAASSHVIWPAETERGAEVAVCCVRRSTFCVEEKVCW